MPTAETPMDLGGNATNDSPATKGRADTFEKRQAAYKFFMDLLKGAAQKQPREEWDKARTKYEDVWNSESMVNLWRAKVDTQAAFLDSEPAVLRFAIPTAHIDDERAESRRNGEQSVYDYIHREMNYADVLDRFRHSADVTNVGYVVHLPDVDKWLPSIAYVEPEQVAFDAACGANIADAGWAAYSQFSSPDALHALYPDVPIKTFRQAAEKGGYLTNAADSEDAKAVQGKMRNSDGSKRSLKQCRVWRFYARGSYALYDEPPAEDGKAVGGTGEAARPDAEFSTTEGEARRYLFLVEGMDVPLLDRMGWPRSLLLDKGEWPITDLSYNKARDSVYGFSDYRHERKLLAEIERVVEDIAAKHGLEGLKIGTSDTLGAKAKAALKGLLEKSGIQVLEDIVDGNGNLMVQVLDLPGPSQEDLTYLTTLIELYDQVSMQPRVARGNEDPEKKATATQIETDMATARATRRLRRFEAALAVIAKKTMQMAHAMLPVLTQVEVPGEDELREVPYVEAEAIVTTTPGAKIIKLGAEAMAGEDAAGWLAMPEDEDSTGFMALLLRSVRISVERGSTQRYVRLQNAAAFRQVFAEVIMPTVQALGAPGALVESVKKLLDMMALDEYDSIGKELEVAAEGLAEQQAAEQQMAAQGQPVGPEASPAAPAAGTASTLPGAGGGI